jgi:hypothetical protein
VCKSAGRCRRSNFCDVDDSFGKGIRGFLRQIAGLPIVRARFRMMLQPNASGRLIGDHPRALIGRVVDLLPDHFPDLVVDLL